ncbi:hypothetical protein JKP88DRAFT_156905 [Tribonema minus]|uniref:Uncharacterized protein n=1 Tax=Tribonema minus TaxID=303371 RepID=A0A835Z4P0_9STRA|nr:hypothetical protein JKP88DRAFT_156905 [Tribonema minus]
MSDSIRRQELEDVLKAQGLDLRSDSALCRAYICGSLDSFYTPELIAFICGVHKYLYEYTDYAQKCAEILPRVARMLAPALGGYENALVYTKKYETPMLKAESLAKFGLPSTWPWLPDDTLITSTFTVDTAIANHPTQPSSKRNMPPRPFVKHRPRELEKLNFS